MDPDKGIDTLIESFLEAFLTGQNNICPINFYSEEAIVSINSRIPDQKATFCLTPADANSATQRWNPGNYIDIVYDCLYTNYSDDKAVEWTCFSCSGFIEFKDLVTTEPLFFSRTFLLSRQPNSCYVIENDIFTVAPIEFQISERIQRMPESTAIFSSSAESSFENTDLLYTGKDPISFLYQYCQKRKRVLNFQEEPLERTPHDPCFQFNVIVDNSDPFPSGQGRTKQEAKRAAASNALEILLAVEANQAPSANTTSESLNNNNVEQPTLPTDDDEITVSGTTRQIISESSSKNPISILAEYAQRKKISLEFKEGQHEMGRFVIEAVLGGKESFSGYGKKKKTAKTNAALLAIEALVSSEQLQASVAKILTLPPDTVEASPGFGNDEGDAEVTVSGTTLQMISESGGKNPISLLAEYSQRKKISLEFREGRDERDRFICQVVLSEEVFSTGCGRNKKSAKTNAALLALETLVSSEEFQAPTPQQLAKRTLTTPKFHTDSMFGHVASWSHKVFEEICSRTPEAIDSGKVIAGLVMWDSEERKGFVLSVGTGNRCVKGDFLSTSGEIVNDCHAEIITMRGFKRVMYSQIEAFLRVLANPDKVNSTMLEQSPKANGKLALRPRFSFHLYINTAPCGDGRVFTLSEPDDALGDPDDPNTHVPVLKDPKKHGILRTKIEKGEGTIPIYDQEIQTLDGINGGERLRTMSCSDKILKWNVLGIQGALLSAFIEPIYLASVTIGTLSHHGHLTRAMCCRLQDMNPLPDSFALNHPLVGTAGVSAGRDTSKSTALSVNWNYADQCEELIDGTTGKLNYNRKSSRLCKKEFFNLFTHVAKLSGCASTDELDTSYIKAKSTFASKYVQAQIQMKQYCHKQNMGNWLSKPIEEKMFGL